MNTFCIVLPEIFSKNLYFDRFFVAFPSNEIFPGSFGFVSLCPIWSCNFKFWKDPMTGFSEMSWTDRRTDIGLMKLTFPHKECVYRTLPSPAPKVTAFQRFTGMCIMFECVCQSIKIPLFAWFTTLNQHLTIVVDSGHCYIVDEVKTYSLVICGNHITCFKGPVFFKSGYPV